MNALLIAIFFVVIVIGIALTLLALPLAMVIIGKMPQGLIQEGGGGGVIG